MNFVEYALASWAVVAVAIVVMIVATVYVQPMIKNKVLSSGLCFSPSLLASVSRCRGLSVTS